MAATNGHCGGFLVTDVAPLLDGDERRVVSLGDWDLAGGLIETGTRRTVDQHLGRRVAWERVALTPEQIETHDPPLPRIVKRDNRRCKGPRTAKLAVADPPLQRACNTAKSDTFRGLPAASGSSLCCHCVAAAKRPKSAVRDTTPTETSPAPQRNAS